MDKKQGFNLADMFECTKDEPKPYKNCCVSSALPNDTAVTMAYVPFQLDKTTYAPETALQEGTLFPALNKPFKGRSLCNG